MADLRPDERCPPRSGRHLVTTDDATVSAMVAVSNAMVRLHKEQFGRGPTRARSYFAGPDLLVCALEEALLPAERRLVDLGDDARVRDTRTSFQVATSVDFIQAVEAILH